MSIAMICSGTELLRGSAVNTNGAYLGKALLSSGRELALTLAVGDRCEELSFAMSTCMRCAEVVIICGGLGPTDDDISLECAARFFGEKLFESAELREKVQAHWQKIHPKMHCPKNQFRQARVPEHGHIIPNPNGSASGIWFDSFYAGRSRRIFLLPGPPLEFEPMVDNYLLPLVAEADSSSYGCTKALMISGIGESTAAMKSAPILADFEGEVADTASAQGTCFFLTGEKSRVENKIALLRELFGDSALEDGIYSVYDSVGAALQKRHLTLATAESCTGGMIAEKFTSIPGISEVFLGGVVSYSNHLKQTLLKVRAETLADHGAVSRECAEEMVTSLCAETGADCGISVTGIAGPGGGTPEKPVGLVFVGVKCLDQLQIEELHLRGSRAMIRERAAATAVNILRKMLINLPEKHQ